MSGIVFSQKLYMKRAPELAHQLVKGEVIELWIVLFSPGILFLFLPLLSKLPKGLHMIICGGWSNLISVIYYTVAIVVYLVLG